RIHELEGALGAKLFVREGPRIRLTAQGRALVESARALLVASSDISNQFRNGMPLKGTLRLGVPYIFGRLCMTEFLGELSHRHPLLKTSLVVADSGTMTAKLQAHELDMAILLQPDPALKVQRMDLGRVRLSWFCGDKVRLPASLSPQELAAHHLIFSSHPSRLHSTITGWLDASGVQPMQFSTCNDPSVLVDVAASGQAIGALPLRVIDGALETGRIKRVHTRPDLPLLEAAVCYQDGALGAGVEEVAILIRELSGRRRLFE
ncbi:MAG: LysR family transcriptional regulator, partial [Burkholderiaceae bacterium]|nr:LysR family transcriptional regulator [Burkholderiaceae bacterium]